MKKIKNFLCQSLLVGALCLTLGSIWTQAAEKKLYLPPIEEPKERETLVIGVLLSEASDIKSGLLEDTFKALQKKLPQYRFEATTITEHDIYLSAVNKEVDFYVAPSGTFAYMQDSSGAIYLAGNQNPGVSNPQHAAGALVVAKADDKRLNKLTDLRNKRVASEGRESFFGMQVVLNELRRATERPDQFFGKFSRTRPMPAL